MASRNLRSASGLKNSPRASAEKQADVLATPSENSGANFETFVRSGIADIKSMLHDFQVSLDFQAQRTTDLEQRVEPLEKKINHFEKKIQEHELLLQRAAEADNKQERFSRKNNVRLIGLKEEHNENSMEMAKSVLNRHFGMEHPKIERAHRDGPKMAPGKPRHFLIRMLSYQDKRYVMSQQRNALADTGMYIIDDLTKADREEKKKWAPKVQEAFSRGIRYHFSSGKWRDRTGNVAPFCQTKRPSTNQDPSTSQRPSTSSRQSPQPSTSRHRAESGP